MIQIQQQLAHLNTVRESLDIISNAVSSLKDGVNNIDLSSIISKIEEQTAELSNKIEGIQIDTTDLAKEQTLTEVSSKLDNLDVDIDLSQIAKQGENTEATNTAILEAVSNIVDTKNLYSVRFESNDDGPNTYTMVLPVVAGVVGDTIIL